MGKDRKPKEHGKITAKWIGKYNVSRADGKGIVEGLAITIVVAILFYRSVFGMLSGLVILPFWVGETRKKDMEKRNCQIRNEFKEYISLVAASLQAGYSLERSLKDSEGEVMKLFNNKCVTGKAIHEMNGKIAMNAQVERAFYEFAVETGLEDAMGLAEILSFSKRAGGDYGRHIRETARKLDSKLMVQQEIDTMTAQKQLELKVMTVMPIVILAYISLTSGDFIAPCYHNLTGVVVMSVCLFIYGAMIKLGRKIIAINI